MPKMSGHVLAAEFKQQYPTTRILFTSGYTDKSVVKEQLKDENVDFIPKPFSAAELARKVRSVLDSGW
jgi:FixJ family two-component response regulator